MTVEQIVEKIRNLAHDRVMPAEYIYDFINLALKDVEARGDFNWQLYKEEIAIPAGSTTINFTKTPVKRIISINPDIDVSLAGGMPQLVSPPTKDITVTFVYTFYHPDFDGTEANKIIPNDWLYILGGTYYLLLHNEDPAAAVYQTKFFEELDNEYERNAFILPVKPNLIEEEIGSI